MTGSSWATAAVAAAVAGNRVDVVTVDAVQALAKERQADFAVFGVGEYTFAPWKVDSSTASAVALQTCD